jgi:HlyD family secretion protein
LRFTTPIDAKASSAMSFKKIAIIAAVVLVLCGIAAFSIHQSQANVVKVTTTTVSRQDLTAIVTGTGQIKPKTYVNVGATAFGRITKLNVKEGDHVQAGAVLATVENVQPSATVAAQRATIASSRTNVAADVAAEQTALANIDAAQADLEQRKLDYDRALALYNDKLIAKQDFDAKKAVYDGAVATLHQRQATRNQARAQTNSQLAMVNQAIASQRSNYDALDKTVSRAPFNGLVTNVPVREGETVVVGIQNAEGSTLMTLADMSVITAEVKVDETDIVNVKLDEPADVTVDALPGRTFHGHVTEVGDQALLRTTGIATSQSTTGTEEAKDFKVVVTIDNVDGQSNEELRPGLSTTARITTARRPNALTVPIQALVQRDPAMEQALTANGGKVPTVSPNATPAPNHTKPDLAQGLYIVSQENRKQRVRFIPIATGVTGATDIEVLGGLKSGDIIVTGRYKILRSLKSGTPVKIDNTPDTIADTSKS